MNLSILLCDIDKSYNNINIIDNNANIKILLDNNNHSYLQNKYIYIKPTYKKQCFLRKYMIHNGITVLYNDIYSNIIYDIHVKTINKKYKLPIIYMFYNNHYIFITHFLKLKRINKSLQNIQIQLLCDTIEEQNIDFGKKIYICGYFGYNFSEHASEISSLCDKLSCNIPTIKTDQNTTLDKFIFVRKSAVVSRYIKCQNNLCYYN